VLESGEAIGAAGLSPSNGALLAPCCGVLSCGFMPPLIPGVLALPGWACELSGFADPVLSSLGCPLVPLEVGRPPEGPPVLPPVVAAGVAPDPLTAADSLAAAVLAAPEALAPAPLAAAPPAPALAPPAAAPPAPANPAAPPVRAIAPTAAAAPAAPNTIPEALPMDTAPAAGTQILIRAGIATIAKTIRNMPESCVGKSFSLPTILKVSA
jgi:hypothetical protein